MSLSGFSVKRAVHVPASSNPTPSLSDIDEGSFEFDTEADAGFNLQRDGDLQVLNSENGNNTRTNDWLLSGDKTATIGDDYEGRLTKITGTDPNMPGSLVLNTWYTISSTRTWEWEADVGESFFFNGTLEVREIANTSNNDTCDVTIDVESEEDECPECCFTPLTPITMADGWQLPIVEVRQGDVIRVAGGVETVTEIIVRENRPMYRIEFADGRDLEASDEHPIYVDGKGYAAINPIEEYKDLGQAEVLAVGDMVLDENGRLNEVRSIKEIDYPQAVYTLGNSKFYANGMLVY